jgi:hypothetical protein
VAGALPSCAERVQRRYTAAAAVSSDDSSPIVGLSGDSRMNPPTTFGRTMPRATTTESVVVGRIRPDINLT